MGTAVVEQRLAANSRKSKASAEKAWAEWSVEERLGVLARWRGAVAQNTESFCQAIDAGPARTDADVLVTEVIPLLAACEFLEKRAAGLLKVRRLGRAGRPAWLGRVECEVHRVPLGRVLVIGPSNYPLFLPGVQVLQALAAGNEVTWKPGRGGGDVAQLFAATMTEVGLPRELLRVTGDTDEAGEAAVAKGADKVFLTGSAAAGRAVMRRLAETATPSIMELSDSAAVVVLESAEISRVVSAIVFGLRLNGSATCMAPRRVFVVGSTTRLREELVERLQEELQAVRPVRLEERVRTTLRELVEEARAQGATVLGEVSEGELDKSQRPVVIVAARPEMRVACSDIFAPVVSVIDVADTDEVLEAQRTCSLALTVSIFCGKADETSARRLAERMQVGTVVINDLIAPTADPRIPFGGRRGSGFGVTRGAEGLLEMTAVKTVLVQRSTSMRHYEATGEAHAALFQGVIAAGHGKTWTERWRGVLKLVAAGRRLRENEKKGSVA